MWLNEPHQWIGRPLSQSRKDELDIEWGNNYKELQKEAERLHRIIKNSDFNPKLPRIADDVRLCLQNIGRANQKLQKIAREYNAKPLEQVWQEDHAIATWCRLKRIKRDKNMIIFEAAFSILNEAAYLYSLCGEPNADADDVKRHLDTLKNCGILMRALVDEKFDGQQTIIQRAQEAGNLHIIRILITEAEAENSSIHHPDSQPRDKHHE